jgi:two-component system, sensor histidine kinase and response regulator
VGVAEDSQSGYQLGIAKGADMKRQTVLIVDDTPANLDLLHAILRNQYHTVTASSGAEALERISAQKPDLILLDVMMPDLDGYQLCTILKSDQRTRDIPVIFVSAKTQEDDEVKGLELGAIDYITKPISPHIVKARVRNHLELKRYRDLLEDLSSAADRTKKEFLRAVSHELRTPLTPIIGMTDLVLNKEQDDEKRKCLSLVQKAALKLLGLVEDLIETSRLQDDSVQLDNRPFALSAFLDDLVAELTPLVESKQLRLNLALDAALPRGIVADAGMLHKALGVLLGNAVKFTPEGEVSLEVRRRDVADDPLLQFSVSDTGIGLAQGDLEKIFKDFTQSDGSLTRPFPGLGLGLTLARRIADLMGGCLRAESRPGGGSIFILEIPLCPAADPPKGPASP